MRFFGRTFAGLNRSVKVAFFSMAGLMVIAAAFNALVPYLFSQSVDALSDGRRTPTALAYLVASIVLLMLIKIIAELRWSVYEPANAVWVQRLKLSFVAQAFYMPFERQNELSTARLVAVSNRAFNVGEDLTGSFSFVGLPVSVEMLTISAIVAFVMPVYVTALILVTISIYFIALLWTSERASAAAKAGNSADDGTSSSESDSKCGDDICLSCDESCRPSDGCDVQPCFG